MEMFFDGYPMRDIARDVGLSPATISNVKKDFVSRAKRFGLMDAAVGNAVDRQLDALLKLSKDAKRLGGFGVVEQGVEYGESFKKIGVEPKDVSNWIEGVYAAATEQGLKPQEVGQMLQRLAYIGDEDEKGLSETLEELERANTQLGESETRLQQLEDEITGLDAKRNSAEVNAKTALDQSHLTLEKLEEYKAAAKSYKKAGGDIADSVPLGHVIDRMIREKKQYEEIIAFYQKNLDLNTEREELFNEIKTLDQTKNSLDEALTETGEKLKSSNELLTALNSWRKAGLDSNRAAKLMTKITEHGAQNGVEKSASLDFFFSDLEQHWEPTLGFRNEHSIASKKLETVNAELGNANDQLAATRRAYESAKSAVDAKDALNRRGVGDDEVIKWEKVLSECGTDVESFRSEMEKLGGIKTNVEKMSGAEKAAERRLSDLRRRVAQEDELYKQFRAANEHFKDQFDTLVSPYMEHIEDKMNEVESQMLDPDTGIESRMEAVTSNATTQFKQAMDDGIDRVSTEMNTLVSVQKKGEADLEKGVEASISRVNNIIKKYEADRRMLTEESYKLGEATNRYRVLSSLMGVLTGEEPDIFAFTLSFTSLLDAVEDFYKRSGKQVSGNEVNQLKKQLEESVQRGQFSI